jgi:hypothetical protein
LEKITTLTFEIDCQTGLARGHGYSQQKEGTFPESAANEAGSVRCSGVNFCLEEHKYRPDIDELATDLARRPIPYRYGFSDKEGSMAVYSAGVRSAMNGEEPNDQNGVASHSSAPAGLETKA